MVRSGCIRCTYRTIVLQEAMVVRSGTAEGGREGLGAAGSGRERLGAAGSGWDGPGRAGTGRDGPRGGASEKRAERAARAPMTPGPTRSADRARGVVGRDAT